MAASNLFPTPGGGEDLNHRLINLSEASSQHKRRRSSRERRTRMQRKKHRATNTVKHETPEHIKTTLTGFLVKRYEADPGTGQRITEKNNSKDIRFFLQIPSGVLNNNGKMDDRRVYLDFCKW